MKINKEFFRQAVVRTTKFASKHAPTGLVILGTCGFVATVVMACKETPAAQEEIEEAKEENPDISAPEIVLIGAKHYWRPAAVGAVSIACYIGAHSVNLKRQAALSAAYAISEKALKEYKEGVIAEFGESKAEKVDEAVAQKHIREYDFPDEVPGQGTLFLLDWTRQEFRADLQTLRKIVNDLNDDMYQGRGKAYFNQEISLNDFLNAVASECNVPTLGSVRLGDQMGWRPDLTGALDLNLHYGHNSKGEPCAHIDIRPFPLTENLGDLYY